MLSRYRQSGAVLFTGLIVLVVMTLLVLGMLKASVLELKIGGIAHTAEQNFSNAEVALGKYINDNNGRFSRDCLTAAAPYGCFCTNPDASQCGTSNVGGNRTSLIAASGSTPATLRVEGPAFFGAQQVDVVVVQIGCADDSTRGSGTQLGGGLQAVYFDIQAVSTGDFQGSAVVHQGIKSPLPAGGCN